MNRINHYQICDVTFVILKMKNFSDWLFMNFKFIVVI